MAAIKDIYLGSDLKICISFTVDGLNMSEMDFDCEFTAGNIRSRCYKHGTTLHNLMKVENSNSYIAFVRADNTSRGAITCKVTAKVPDADYETADRKNDGFRTEVGICTLENCII